MKINASFEAKLEKDNSESAWTFVIWPESQTFFWNKGFGESERDNRQPAVSGVVYADGRWQTDVAGEGGNAQAYWQRGGRYGAGCFGRKSITLPRGQLCEK